MTRLYQHTEWYFMRIRIAVSLLICSPLVACGADPNALSEANIRRVIDPVIAKEKFYCTEFRMGTRGNPVGDALVAKGWAVQKETPPSNQWPPPIKMYWYELTAEGTRVLPAPGNVCYAKTEVVKVVSWTPPAQLFTDTVTRVKYTYRAADVAPWVKEFMADKAIRSALQLPDSLDEERNQEIVLHLTNNGWTAE